ncbi:MAG: extracellular solute-binding protein [Treponema sp.]|jgi:raffinose/stachyose/melibiose transport system substrate-binding protein|nr:extracellular solute-binding protein [Treponema sp.]
MNKRFFVLAAVLAVLCLAGCSKKEEGSSAPASGGKIKIEFFQQKRETVEIVDKIIAEFTAQNPNITVEQNNVPDAASILKTRIAADDAPDVFSGWNNPDARLLIDEGYVKDLTNEPVMNRVEDQFKDFILYKGRQWAVPISINFVGVFYNKDYFEQNGLSIPRTRAEFYALCDAVKKLGGQPLQVTDKEQWTIGHGNTIVAENMYDPALILEVIHGGRSVKDIPGFADYADWLERSRKNWTQADYLGTAYEAGLGDFANGKGAMLFQGNWIIPVLIKANPNFNYGVFPFPAAKAEDTKVHWGIDHVIMQRAEPRSAAHGDAAAKFVDFFFDRGVQIWADLDGSVSCVKGVKSGLPQYQPITDMIQAGRTYSGWFTDDWPAGCYDQYNIVQQNFLTSFNKEAFYKEMDTELKNYKGM